MFPEAFLEKFSVIDRIGKVVFLIFDKFVSFKKGSQGVVYKIEDKITKKVYAAKHYNLQEEEHIFNVKILFILTLKNIFGLNPNPKMGKCPRI